MTSALLFCYWFFLYVTSDALGKGIPTEISDKIKCYGRNEVPECVEECPPAKTCKNKDISFSCLQSAKRCEFKCVCKAGYYRSSIGDCISREDCDRCIGEHEYYACGGFCDNICSELHQQSKSHCPIVNIVCNQKCYCEDGYARDDNNKCIPIKSCENPNLNKDEGAIVENDGRCSPNEDYQECHRSCPPDSCISLVAKFSCVTNPPCVPGCRCKEGYLRNNATSQCMLQTKCPQLVNMPGDK